MPCSPPDVAQAAGRDVLPVGHSSDLTGINWGQQRWAEAVSEALALLALLPSFPTQLPNAVIIWAGPLLFIAATAEPGAAAPTDPTQGEGWHILKVWRHFFLLC